MSRESEFRVLITGGDGFVPPYALSGLSPSPSGNREMPWR